MYKTICFKNVWGIFLICFSCPGVSKDKIVGFGAWRRVQKSINHRNEEFGVLPCSPISKSNNSPEPFNLLFKHICHTNDLNMTEHFPIFFSWFSFVQLKIPHKLGRPKATTTIWDGGRKPPLVDWRLLFISSCHGLSILTCRGRLISTWRGLRLSTSRFNTALRQK